MLHYWVFILIIAVTGCSSGTSGPASESQTPAPATQAPAPATQPPASTPPTTPPSGPPMPELGETPAQTPTVNAGPDQTVKLGTRVTLSGSSTTTESNPTYLWQFTSVPAGSGATLTDAATLTPSFSPDLTGLYVVSLSLEGGPSDSVSIEVQANLLTLHFSGTFGSDGIVDGTFTYEITQGPNATNVRSLQPNVMYRLTNWNIVVNSGQLADQIPSTVFNSAQPDNTAEFCEGICIFSSTSLAELRFHNAGPFVLQLAFQHADPTPFINPPGTLAEWGTHFQSLYRVPCPVCGPLSLLQTGVLSNQ